MNFTTYATSKGLHLLPDDIRWLRTTITKIPQNARKRVLTQYVTLWVDTMGKLENAPCAMNLGRRTSNLWLQEQVESQNLL